ncbi:uncharacterized protein LOC124949435 [Vespa velutina]|uniref:uncharacterized protein LOC124949435 n=1 Tax=Vespa velutina TaxID=202808 RepID=UPI001FB54F44|nr:uncharacterized protein LOC124949435 [Vespa velutina]
MKLMMKTKNFPVSILEGCMKICDNEKLPIYTYKRIKSFKIPCKVVGLDTGIIDNLSMILSKHNPFTGVINFHLQRFINNGMVQRLKDRTFQKTFNDMPNYLQPVSLTSIMSLIFFIQIGIISSVFILIIENNIPQ